MNLKKSDFTKANLWGVFVFVILIIFTQYLSYQRYTIFKTSEHNELYNAAINTRERIQDVFAQNVTAAKTLAFIVQKYGEPQDFDSISQSIIANNKSVDVLQLVKGGNIIKVFPLKGNEIVLGYNILKDSLRNKEALKAIENREMYFSGPFELKQGGIGIVGRLPIFINNEFWGFSACVLKLKTLVKAANLINSDSNYFNYQLSKVNPNNSNEEFFLEYFKTFNSKNSVKVKLLFGDLYLSVMKNESKTVSLSIMFIALGIALSILGGILTWNIVKKPEELAQLVKQKNNELFESEYRYRTALSRVSDAFVSLDKKWCYTYMNHKAGNIFNRNPAEMIGKHIWTEFPEGIGQPFHLTYEKAMVEQKYQYLEEYYQPYDKWFENHIYPSEDGLSIYFRDITEKKKSEIAIKESEEKYKAIIEQATEGILLADKSGNVLHVNNSFSVLSGYSLQELKKMNLSELVPPDELKKQRADIKKILAGNKFLIYRKIKTKSGNIVDTEISPSLLSDGKIQAFVRDISERIKAEKQILNEKELSDSIIKSLPGVFYLFNKDGEFLRWNTDFEIVTGYTGDEISKIKPIDLFDETEKKIISDKINNVFVIGKDSVEANFLTKSGKKIPFYFTGRLVEYEQTQCLVGVGIDITERIKAQNEIIHSENQLRQLATHLQNIREEERIHIAREIHDELGQLLTGIKMSLSWLKAKTTDFNNKEIDKKNAELSEMIDNSIITVRKIAKELRPGVLDNLGLEAAIEWQSIDFTEKTKIKVNFITELGEANFDDKINTAIFRIYQETLTNIVRHANAKNIYTKLYISPKNNIVLEVADDGVGIDFDKQKKLTFGLLGMKERAENLNGNFVIEKNINGGTIVKVNIPLK